MVLENQASLANEARAFQSPKSTCEKCEAIFTTTNGLRELISPKGCSIEDHEPEVSGQCILRDVLVSRCHQIRAVCETATDRKIDDGSQGHPLEGVKIKCMLGLSDHESQIDPIVLNVLTEEGDLAENFLASSSLKREIVNSEMMSIIKAAISSCSEQNCSCQATRVPLLPRRVLQISHGSASESSKVSVKLYESQKNEIAEYVALSYCWGGPQKTITTTENLAAHKVGLAQEFLPQAIQDAIILTEYLGYQFLWIDCLCIVQDDTTDKMIDINSMGTIYERASLTLLAGRSPSVNQGFLPEWPFPGLSGPMKSNISLPNDGIGSLQVYRIREPFIEYTRSFNGPLAKRAWAYQESELSQRSLLFSLDEVVYSCASTSKVIRHPLIQYTPDDPFEEVIDEIKGKSLRSIVLPMLERDKENEFLATQWLRVVYDYAPLAVTNWEDRLPALAGIAGKFAAAWGEDGYRAGLWERYLVRHLGWKMSGYAKEVLAIPAWQSPTWSWATHDFTIGPYPEIDFDEVVSPDATLLSCSCTRTSDLVPLGGVKEGIVRLLAKTMRPSHMKQWEYMTVTMDYDERFEVCADESLRFSAYDDVDLRYLLLGEDRDENGIGLVILACQDGWRRVGQIKTKRSLEHFWADLEKKDILIR